MAGVILAALPNVARAAPDLVSKPYDVARALLLRSGFKPVPLKHNEDLHSDEVDYFCADGFCERYPEALNCTGTGLNPCMFVYASTDKGRYFIVVTRGEGSSHRYGDALGT